MLQVLAQDGAIFSRTDYLSRRADDTWLDYCLIVARPELAKRWLRDFETPRLATVLRSFERDPLWRLRVAQVHAAARDWPSARRELTAAKALVDSPEARMSLTEERVRSQLTLGQASVTIKEGFARRTPGMFSGLSVDLRDPPFPGPQESHRWAWLRGLAALGSGHQRDAVAQLTMAERRAEAEMGSRIRTSPASGWRWWWRADARQVLRPTGTPSRCCARPTPVCAPLFRRRPLPRFPRALISMTVVSIHRRSQRHDRYHHTA